MITTRVQNLAKLSAYMAFALDLAHRHGGELVRYHGGYWAPRGISRTNGVPDEWTGMQTVKALVARKRMAWSEWQKGKDNPTPIAARVVEEEAEAA